MPEIQDDGSEKFARVGSVSKSHDVQWGPTFRFLPNPNVDPIPASTIQNLVTDLEIISEGWGEFSRTHWAVKDVDLFQVLFEHQARLSKCGSQAFRSSGAVRFPVETLRNPKLVAVMMLFKKEFDVVHETIRGAVDDAGLISVRVDNIWEHDHVMGDILSTLWEVEIVIADLTGRNPNMFYEVGLAHALLRKTVLLTQNVDDVPFDLQPIR